MKKLFLFLVIFMLSGVISAQEAQNEPAAEESEPAAAAEEAREEGEAAPAGAEAAENQGSEAQNTLKEEEKTPETAEKPAEPEPKETKKETPAPAETAKEEPAQPEAAPQPASEPVIKEEKPSKMFYNPSAGLGIGASIFSFRINNDFDFQGDKMLYIDNAFEWMNLHPDVMSLILLSYLIIPNYFIFRNAPRNTRHTLPQGFFIQVFTAIVFLVINMFYDITSLAWGTFVLGNVWLYFAYKQLFGYGIWGTLWRLALSLLCAHLLALMMLGLDFMYHMLQTGDYNLVEGFKLFVKLLIRMITNSDT